MQIDTNKHVVWLSDAETRNLLVVGVIRPALCISGLWQPIDVKVGEESVLNVKGKTLTLIREDVKSLYEQREFIVRIKVKVRTVENFTLIVDDETAKSGQFIS